MKKLLKNSNKIFNHHLYIRVYRCFKSLSSEEQMLLIAKIYINLNYHEISELFSLPLNLCYEIIEQIFYHMFLKTRTSKLSFFPYFRYRYFKIKIYCILYCIFSKISN